MKTDLQTSAGRNSILQIGDCAPDFVLNSTTGGAWRLSEHSGEVVVLLFYPKNETLVCTKQMCSLRDNWTDYLKTKAVVIGVSPGTIEEHKEFSQRHLLPIPILADASREITKIYCRHPLLPVGTTRAVVIVNAKGIVSYRKVMFRAFRPTDKSVIASIYAARTEAIVERSLGIIKKANEKNKALAAD